MQTKTVKLAIRAKMNSWLGSIAETDVQLAKEVEDNLIVTGGCIASMLLNEEVNDYDVYIKDINVLHRLAEHYVDLAGLSDEITVMSSCNLDTLLSNMHTNRENIYQVAVDNLKDTQVKLFMDANRGGKVVEKIIESSYHPVYISPNAITLSDSIQIVTRFSGDSKTIHKNFDFVHATNYYTTDEGLVLNQKALESLLTKQLSYTGSLYPLTSVFRMKKFILRHWKINAGEILKILFQVSELDLTNISVLEEQLIGVDVAYFSALIDSLKSIQDKPEKLNSAYVSVIIDKIFND